MRDINLQEASVDLILSNDDLPYEIININENQLSAITSDITPGKTKSNRKRKNENEKQLKPAIKMSSKKLKTGKHTEKVIKNVSINDIVCIHDKDTVISENIKISSPKEFNDNKMKSHSMLNLEKNTHDGLFVSEDDKKLPKKIALTKESLLNLQNKIKENEDNNSINNNNSDDDLNMIKSKKRRLSVSESSDAASTDDQKDSLYHKYLAIGEIVKTDPLFIDLTLEERIKLRRRQRNSNGTILSFEDINLDDLEKYKSMRDNNDPSLIRKGKGKGKNDEYYKSHSIESFVTKNKEQKESLLSHNYNTPVVNNKEDENLKKNKHHSSTHKKSRKGKNKKLKSSNDNEVVKQSISINKGEVKSSKTKEENINIEIKKSENNDLLKNQQKTDIVQENNTSLQEDKINIKSNVDFSSFINKEIKEEVISKVEKESTNNIQVESNIGDNKETNVNKKANELKIEIKLNEIKEETNHGNIKSVGEPVDIKENKKDQNNEQIQEQNDVKKELEKEKSESGTLKNSKDDHSFKKNKSITSESAPTSPVVKKRKRGRPSKSNTASPSPMSPDLIGNNTQLSSEIDYSIYGMLRTSRRHHGTFEKKCVQCHAIISPTEYAKNGVICGSCWKSNFKD